MERTELEKRISESDRRSDVDFGFGHHQRHFLSLYIVTLLNSQESGLLAVLPGPNGAWEIMARVCWLGGWSIRVYTIPILHMIKSV